MRGLASAPTRHQRVAVLLALALRRAVRGPASSDLPDARCRRCHANPAGHLRLVDLARARSDPSPRPHSDRSLRCLRRRSRRQDPGHLVQECAHRQVAPSAPAEFHARREAQRLEPAKARHLLVLLEQSARPLPDQRGHQLPWEFHDRLCSVPQHQIPRPSSPCRYAPPTFAQCAPCCSATSLCCFPGVQSARPIALAICGRVANAAPCRYKPAKTVEPCCAPALQALTPTRLRSAVPSSAASQLESPALAVDTRNRRNRTDSRVVRLARMARKRSPRPLLLRRSTDLPRQPQPEHPRLAQPPQHAQPTTARAYQNLQYPDLAPPPLAQDPRHLYHRDRAGQFPRGRLLPDWCPKTHLPRLQPQPRLHHAHRRPPPSDELPPHATPDPANRLIPLPTHL